MPATDTIREFRETVLAIDDGDMVDLATRSYDYANPIEVADANPPREWRVPHGEDWLIRDLVLEGTNGGTYTAVYNDATQSFALYSNGDRLSPITQFDRVNVDEPAWDARELDAGDDWDVGFPIPDGVTPDAVRNAVDERETLRGVVDELDWPSDDEHARDRVRALVFAEGRYTDLNRPEGQP